jgi:protein tyrosine phosphatase
MSLDSNYTKLNSLIETVIGTPESFSAYEKEIDALISSVSASVERPGLIGVQSAWKKYKEHKNIHFLIDAQKQLKASQIGLSKLGVTSPPSIAKASGFSTKAAAATPVRPLSAIDRLKLHPYYYPALTQDDIDKMGRKSFLIRVSKNPNELILQIRDVENNYSLHEIDRNGNVLTESEPIPIKQFLLSYDIDTSINLEGVYKILEHITPQDVHEQALPSGNLVFEDIVFPLKNALSAEIGHKKYFFHANTVTGIEKSYIASQMPFRKNAQEVYWKAIYDQGITNVLDLTNKKDREKSINSKALSVRLQPTYPTQLHESAHFGEVSVTLIDKEPKEKEEKELKAEADKGPEKEGVVEAEKLKKLGLITYTYEIIDKNYSGIKKKVKRTSFEGWPDQSPIKQEDLKTLVNHFENISDGGEALIHCRAGVGRTGTVIACLLIKQLIKKGKIRTDPVGLLSDIMGVILQGRKERSAQFVQTYEQMMNVIEFTKDLLGIKDPLILNAEQLEQFQDNTHNIFERIFAPPPKVTEQETKVRGERETKEAASTQVGDPAKLEYVKVDAKILDHIPLGGYMIIPQPKGQDGDWFKIMFKKIIYNDEDVKTGEILTHQYGRYLPDGKTEIDGGGESIKYEHFEDHLEQMELVFFGDIPAFPVVYGW